MSMRYPNGFIRPNYNPLEVADAPTAVTPTAGSEAASVDFTPPSNVGGAAVSEYYAVVQPGNITATSVTPPVAVTGLTNGVEYTTKVWANNSYGPSPYSAESSGFIPQVIDYVEDVFSTYLYTGTSAPQTITNGIDLAGEGGLVWIKDRPQINNNFLVDTTRGATKNLESNTTNAEYTLAQGLTAFTSSGFSLGTNAFINGSPDNFVSWTFRKAPKFFDVVTWTGTGGSRAIAHALDSTPGCIIIKRTDSTDAWYTVHRSLPNGFSDYLTLNTTSAAVGGSAVSSVGSSTFTVSNYYNGSGSTWVAYVFAHNAGGFGDDGEQNVISCGSKTITSSQPGTDVINLGWEPQWVLIKRATGSSEDWIVLDNMRGLAAPPNSSANSKALWPNLSSAEDASASGIGASALYNITATGFSIGNDLVNTSDTYIYIAIRRPMKTPEAGTEVFAADGLASATAPNPWFTSGFPVDMSFTVGPSSPAGFGGWFWSNRFTPGVRLDSSSSAAEVEQGNIQYDYMTGAWDPNSSDGYFTWMFRRAPSVFDVVAYTGTGSARTVAHNLTVVPELMIVKSRTQSEDWWVYNAAIGAANALYLNGASGQFSFASAWNSTAPTTSVFSLGTLYTVNNSGSTYIAYLFATLAGVSKVGSYTGTGADLNVDCGFSAGARFILIKRTDSTGDWYVWDSVRGIVAGNDPYLLLNSTAAEVTNTDYVDTLASGFTVTSSAPAALNASGGAYIFLAIA
jgi:hypothetical protein